MEANPAPVLMTKKDTAALIGFSESALDWALHNKTAPPSAKIMGRRVFRREDVLKWIDEQFQAQNEAA